MSTTSLFVEILIIGLQALIWLVLLVGVGWDLDSSLNLLKELKEYAALVTILLIATAYVLGIFVDRAADSFYEKFRYSSKKSPVVPMGEMRLRIMKESEGMAKFLEYQRSRLRIARATVFNLFVIIVVGSIWFVQYPGETTGIGVIPAWLLMVGIGIITLILAIITTRRIDKAQFKRTRDAYQIVTNDKNNKEGTS